MSNKHTVCKVWKKSTFMNLRLMVGSVGVVKKSYGLSPIWAGALWPELYHASQSHFINDMVALFGEEDSACG